MEDIGMMKTETLMEILGSMQREIDAIKHREIQIQKSKDKIKKLENRLEELQNRMKELKQDNKS